MSPPPEPLPYCLFPPPALPVCQLPRNGSVEFVARVNWNVFGNQLSDGKMTGKTNKKCMMMIIFLVVTLVSFAACVGCSFACDYATW